MGVQRDEMMLAKEHLLCHDAGGYKLHALIVALLNFLSLIIHSIERSKLVKGPVTSPRPPSKNLGHFSIFGGGQAALTSSN